MRKFYGLALTFLVSAPLFASAATLLNVVNTFKQLANAIVPLFMVLAVAVFLWGIVKYITAGGDATKETAARGYIIYGLLGIFVMVAFWGIIQIVATTFGVQTGGSLPGVQLPY